MTFKAWIIIAIELLLSAFIITGLCGKINAEEQRADKAELLATERQQMIDDMQVRQRDVAALDAKYTKELAIAKAENDALQRKLDRGGRVLVAGNCKKQAAGTASMDNGTTVELSDIAGRNVLGIRAGIKNDQSKIAALQQYIIEQCLK